MHNPIDIRDKDNWKTLPLIYLRPLVLLLNPYTSIYLHLHHIRIVYYI
jgi:hypothetical protein